MLAISLEGFAPSKLISIHLPLWASSGIFSGAGDVPWMVFSTKATTSGSERHSYGCNVTTNLTQLLNAALPPTHLDLLTREHTAIWLAPGSNAIRNWERET